MTTWTSTIKNASLWNNPNKSATSYTNTSKSFFEQFILKEDEGYLFLENGDNIILEQSVPIGNTWINTSKT